MKRDLLRELRGILPRRQTRKCFWVALHFPSQEHADRWLKERATVSERLEACQLQTGDRIGRCDVRKLGQ